MEAAAEDSGCISRALTMWALFHGAWAAAAVQAPILAQPLGLLALKCFLAHALAKGGKATCKGQMGQGPCLSSCSLH